MRKVKMTDINIRQTRHYDNLYMHGQGAMENPIMAAWYRMKSALKQFQKGQSASLPALVK